VSLEYLFTVVSAWLVPGAAHWLLGYRVRGVVLGISILGLFWLGESLAIAGPIEDKTGKPIPAKPIAVSREIHPIFFACQVGNGFSTLLAQSLWGAPRYKDETYRLDPTLPRHLNLAILLTSVSGLLNYLLVLHALDPRSWIQAAEDARTGKRGKTPPEAPPAKPEPKAT
jgi:hypothetical protein